MNDLESKRRAEAFQSLVQPKESSMSTAWNVIVIVLAAIGALALIAVVGMFWMHNSMMGGVGMGCL